MIYWAMLHPYLFALLVALCTALAARCVMYVGHKTVLLLSVLTENQLKRIMDWAEKEQQKQQPVISLCTRDPNSCKIAHCDFPRCTIDEGSNE